MTSSARPTAHTLDIGDGRVLRVHDSGIPAGGKAADLTIIWHHGSPQSGTLLEPLLRAASERAIRLVGYGRASYGGSTPDPGRTVASAAADVERIADALGLESFAVMGASGGGPHALACAALLPDRVTATACLAGIAPFTTAFDWFDGMVAPDGLRAALDGREARALFAQTDEFNEDSFIGADYTALSADWSSLGADAGAAGDQWPDGLIDDDVAFTIPWGFELADIASPVLLVQGDLDRVVPAAHARWQLSQLSNGELWQRPHDGHISVLAASAVAMDWLRARS